jgi:indolepyruvate ferredoxin oxidoreductase
MNAVVDTDYRMTLQDRFTIEQGRVYLNGTQALLRLMLDQRRADQRNGLNTAGFVTGYPGSPMQGVDGAMLSNKRLLEENHVVFRPGLNEDLAVTAVWGTQTLHTVPGAKYEGVFSLWYGKALGVDRSADALHLANFRGIGRNGGVLIAAGDDPHARTTAYPTDTSLTFASLYMPVLAPGNVQEIIDLGLHGFAMSRASGLWMGFKIVNDVMEATSVVDTSPQRIKPIIPEVDFEGRRVEARCVSTRA